MKLRIEGNTIRLRVKKSDLLNLKEKEVIQEHLSFSPEEPIFYYELTIDRYIDEIKAVYSNSKIAIKIPFNIAVEWIESSKVGIENSLSNGLYILIEKDFPCKTRENEDKSDLFQELEDLISTQHITQKC